LSWTQYKTLIRLDNQDQREFYIAESVKKNWTSRQLERQINSSLFERLLMSNDKESVLAVAKNEKLPPVLRSLFASKYCTLRIVSDYVLLNIRFQTNN